MPFYILGLLELQGKLQIRDLGTFRMQAVPATIDQERNSISPPGNRGSFVPDEEGESNLEAYISYMKGCSPMEASTMVKHFVSDIRKNLHDAGEISIEGLGRFSRLSPSGSMHFIPDARAFNRMHFALINIELPVVSGSFIEKEEPVEPAVAVGIQSEGKTMPAPVVEGEVNEDAFLPDGAKTRRRTLLIALLILLFLVLCSSAYIYWRYYHQPDKSEAVIVPGENGEETLIPESPPSTEDTPLPGESEPDQVHETEHVPVDVPETHEEETENDTGIGSTLKEPEVAEREEESAALFGARVTQTDWECLIVVGAFAKRGNVERMIDRLTALGLSVRIWEVAGLTRVGVPVECLSSASDSTLQTLRESVEEESWIFFKE